MFFRKIERLLTSIIKAKKVTYSELSLKILKEIAIESIPLKT